MLFLDALHHKSVPTPPVWLMRQAGRHLPEYQALRKQCPDFIQFCLTPDLITTATVQPITRYGLDAAIIFSDILMIPYGLGVPLTFQEGIGPVLTTLQTVTDIEHLATNLPNIPEHLAPVYQGIAQTRRELAPDKALIGFAGAPWTVGCYMLDNHPSKDALKIRQLAYQTPATFQHLMATLVAGTVAHLAAQIHAGADVVMLFDSWAGLCPPALQSMALMQPVRDIAQAIQRQHPNVPILYFPRNVDSTTLCALATHMLGPIQGFGLSHTVDLTWARQHLPAQLVLQGNLDPAVLLTTPSSIQTETRAMLACMANRPGYVVNLGHGVHQHTPPAHVQVLVETIRGYGGHV